MPGMRKPEQQLGRLVKQRRESLGIYTVSEAATRAGISRETWTNVEKGEPVKPVTYRKVEDALQWEHGSCGAILAGREPTLVNSEPAEADVPEIDALRALMREALDRLDSLERGRRQTG